MYIKNLTLKNFKKHITAEFTFEPGTNVIAGNNYSGKTSIQQAILIGLYGNSAVSIANELLATRGSKDFEITIQLSDGTTIIRTSKNSKITRAGEDKPYAVGHTAVNGAVEDLTGLDKNTFIKVHTSLQGAPQQLLEMEGAELQRFIEDCTGLSQLDKVTKLSLREARSKRDLIDQLTAMDILSSDQLQSVISQKGEAEISLMNLAGELQGMEMMLQSREDSINALHERLQFVIAHNAKVKAYEQVSERFQELSLMGLSDTDVPKLEQDVKELNLSLNNAKLYADYEAKFESSSRKLQQLKDNLPEGVEGVEEPTDKLADRVQELKGDLREVTENVRMLNKTLSTTNCPTCNKPYDDSFDKVSVQADLALQITERTRLAVELDAACAELDNMNKRNAVVVRIRKEQENRLAELTTLSTQADHWENLKEGLKIYAGSEKELAKEIDETNKTILQAVRHNAAAEQNNRQYHKVREELAVMEKPTEPAVDVQEIKDLLVTSKDDVQQIKGSIVDLRNKQSKLRTDLQATTDFLDRHNRAALKCAELGREMDDYTAIAGVLKDRREKLATDSMNGLLQTATMFVSACTSGDIKEIGLKEGAISYQEGDHWFSKHSASGAQKTLIGLGMKLGVYKLVRSNYSGLLLDEVSADMSEGISMLCMLNLGMFSEQVIAVSHRSLDIANNTINL